MIDVVGSAAFKSHLCGRVCKFIWRWFRWLRRFRSCCAYGFGFVRGFPTFACNRFCVSCATAWVSHNDNENAYGHKRYKWKRVLLAKFASVAGLRTLRVDAWLSRRDVCLVES